MYIPGDSWLYDREAYQQRAREVTDAARPADVTQPDQAASSPSAYETDDLVAQLARLQLGRIERRRASDAGATPAPRTALSGIGGSTRWSTSSAASLMGRERHIQSARYELSRVPESPTGSPEYEPREPARHSSAYATHESRFDTASHRKGGLMSGLKKGVVKGLKHAFGFGVSRKDTSIRRDSTFRMDAPSPGRALAQHTHDECLDAQVAEHDSPPMQAPEPQSAPASRRRQRDRATDSIRRFAGSAMHAAETALPRPDAAWRNDPHERDSPLIERARAGLNAANPPIPHSTKSRVVTALIEFSVWLKQIDRPPMQGRLFSQELTAEAWKFVEVGGDPNTASALEHLRDMETNTTGVANIARRRRVHKKAATQADGAFIAKALGGHRQYRDAALAFSDWLAREGHCALTDPIVEQAGAPFRRDDRTRRGVQE